MDTCFKHSRFKTTYFKPLKHKQQSYVCAFFCFCVRRPRIFFAALLDLNDYISTTICIRIPVFASILINSDLGLKRESTGEKKHICNSILDPDFGLKGEAVQYSSCLPLITQQLEKISLLLTITFVTLIRIN